jgi:CheY-like chemotaxis protein
MATSTVQSPTILVIDDDPGVRDVIQRLLELHGFRVVVAADGREGLAEVAHSRPDAVVCDLTMPVMDGLEFARRLRANPRHRRVLLIALTGRGWETDTVDTWRVGFDRLLEKPVRGEILAQLIHSRLPPRGDVDAPK